LSPISPSPPKGTILTNEDVNPWDAITLNPTSSGHRKRLYKAPGNGESGVGSGQGVNRGFQSERPLILTLSP
jgi:hypothetical protein